ncbi:MAG: Hpt domain-containing protein [Opitutales bacterium]
MPSYREVLIETFEIPPEYPILDADQVEMLKEAGEGLLEDLIETFREECEPRLELVRQQAEAHNAEGLRAVVHFIAGSAANVGLSRLAELCRSIEYQIKEDRFSAFEETPDYVSTEFAHGLAELCET